MREATRTRLDLAGVKVTYIGRAIWLERGKRRIQVSDLSVVDNADLRLLGVLPKHVQRGWQGL